MLAPVSLLLATAFSTFGPIAQTDDSLFVADRGSIVRVDKSDTSKRVTLTAPTQRRIAAIDVAGDRVIYGTAPAPQCNAVPTFPPDTLYVHYLCSLTDDESEHELKSVSMFGGDEQVLVRTAGGVTQIAHDDDWIYWLEPSSGISPSAARINRKNRTTGAFELVAAGLVVSAVNQHPFALSDDAVYVVSGTRLLRLPKRGGAVRDVAEVNADSSVAESDGMIYFVDAARVYALDSRTDRIADAHVPLASGCGATYPIAILGAAPGFVVAAEGSGCTNTAFLGWIASDLCANRATLLGSTTSDRIHAYFIPPLSDPAVAVDANGVWFGDTRKFTFDHTGCRRRSTSR